MPDKHCRKIEPLLVSYVHEELDSDGAAVVEDHIQACPPCRELCDDLRRCMDMVGSLPRVQAPPDFLFAIRRRIQADEARPAREGLGRTLAFLFRPPLPQAVLAASFVLVFLSAFSLGRYMFPRTGAPSATEIAAATVHTEDRISGPVELVSYEPGGYAAPSAAAGGNGLIKMVGFGADEPFMPTINPYQTPSEFVQAMVKNDPQFENSEIIPIPQGALVHTSLHLYEVTISNLAFMRAQRLLMMKDGKLPDNLAMAKQIYNLKITSLPSPLSPVESAD